jgi:hypothetical protein
MAPEPARVEAYAKLRPLSYHQTKTTMTSDWMGVMTQRKVDYLQLAGGERVYYPEDILAVVPSESPAGRAASDSRSSRKLGNGLQLGGAAAITAGVVLAVLSFATVDSSGELNTTPLYLGLGLSLGGVGLLSGAHFVNNSAADEAATAFETYDASLQQQLSVCVEEQQVHGCP